jgi:hypothetical protein
LAASQTPVSEVRTWAFTEPLPPKAAKATTARVRRERKVMEVSIERREEGGRVEEGFLHAPGRGRREKR